ncbi:hypothetical protein V3N99_04885 [Dermatophilaceae bacterium Soc4.6]
MVHVFSPRRPVVVDVVEAWVAAVAVAGLVMRAILLYVDVNVKIDVHVKQNG